MTKALFLDRDGVINIDKGYVHRVEDFEFAEGIFDVLRYFQGNGYLLIVITNQAGIGRGIYSEADFLRLTAWMLERFAENGVRIAKVYYTPSHPEFGIGKYKRDDFRRKPQPGMILQAQREFGIDLEKSILVGDRESDIEAGRRAGVGRNVIVLNGNPVDPPKTRADFMIQTVSGLSSLLEINI